MLFLGDAGEVCMAEHQELRAVLQESHLDQCFAGYGLGDPRLSSSVKWGWDGTCLTGF
jgi:hypothetical protein